MAEAHLRHLHSQGLVVEVGLGETLDGVFAAVDGSRLVVEIHETDGGHVAVFGGRGARQDLSHEIDDGIAASPEPLDDLELLGGLPVRGVGGTVGNETDLLALQIETMADEIPRDRKSTRLNSSHSGEARMPSSA